MILSIIGGVVGGLILLAFIAAIGGIVIKGAKEPPICTQGHGYGSCRSWRTPSCGAGHCAQHCQAYCCGHCIDPRPVPKGRPDHKPTVIKGGRE